MGDAAEKRTVVLLKPARARRVKGHRVGRLVGKASITLRRNGRLVIRGAYVETRARGVNRIKGGSVQIN